MAKLLLPSITNMLLSELKIAGNKSFMELFNALVEEGVTPTAAAEAAARVYEGCGSWGSRPK